MSSGGSRGFRPRPGDIVERHLEGIWFPASIVAVDSKTNSATIRFLDDNNVESNVGFEDLREAENRAADAKSVQDATVKDTLLKPLAGLIDDDSEARQKHEAKVTIHNTSESEEAIILNGAENKLAAGGGLRALRYLKN